MSHVTEKLLKLASDYDSLATKALLVTAAKKENKKLDPKAKIRNRGEVCVSAEQAKDQKDHFPINDEGQARNALARVQQLGSAPWYKGTLEGLKSLVARKVKSKYPKINVSGKDSKKKSSEYYDVLLSKFAQELNYGDMSEYELAQLAQKGESWPGVGELKGEPWLSNLLRNGKINQRSYQNAVQVLNMQAAPTTRSTTTTTQTQPQASGFGAIDKTFQTMLGMNPDGKLGPITQSALEFYKKSVGIPNGAGNPTTAKTDSQNTNQQAFEHLKSRPEYQAKKPMAFDDNSNTYAGYSSRLGF